MKPRKTKRNSTLLKLKVEYELVVCKKALDLTRLS